MTFGPPSIIIREIHKRFMAKAKIGLSGGVFVEGKPKMTRQGQGKNTKYAATARNKAKKAYRGQGK